MIAETEDSARVETRVSLAGPVPPYCTFDMLSQKTSLGKVYFKETTKTFSILLWLFLLGPRISMIRRLFFKQY